MAKIKKSEESRPQLFFNFTWKYVIKLFLRAPWAEKMTFSQKTGHVWFGDTYFLNPWCLPVNLPYWSPLDTSLKLFCTSGPMCVATRVASILTHILKRIVRLLWLFNRLTNIPSIASFLFFLQLLLEIRLLWEGESITDGLETTTSYEKCNLH